MKRFSLLAVLQKVLRRIPRADLDVNCLHCLEYKAKCGQRSAAPVNDIYVRGGTLLDLKKMAECENFPEGLAERFKAKEHCVVAVSGSGIVGYQWFCDKPSRLEERYSYKVRIPPDALYGYDAFVRPECRRLKIWSRFHTEYLEELLATLHRNKIIVMVDQGNIASMKAHLRLGYVLHRKVYVLKIFGKSLCIARDISVKRKELRPAPQFGTAGQHAGNTL